jgi:hypothetical protein
MRITALLCALLGSVGIACAQQPYVQSLKHVVEVTFPGKDTVKESVNKINCAYKSDRISYGALLVKLQHEPNNFFTKHIKDSVYAEVLRSFPKGGIVFYKKDFTWNGLQGLAFANIQPDDLNGKYRYYRCLYFNHSVLYLSVWSLDSLRVDDKRITGFFNSLKLTAGASNIDQDNMADKLFSGTTALIIVFVLLGVVLIIVVKKKKAWKN